jgi:epoxyqueuosine reductase
MTDDGRKRLLLHVCCAPCAVYVHQVLSATYDVTCLFYNPNIQPEAEYVFRKKELEKTAALKSWDVIYEEYDPETWNAAVKGLENEPERGARCSLCFGHRLKKTFEVAAAGHFDVTASTLSISPYKNTKQINKEGDALAAEYGICFLGENFKKQDGYVKAKKLAHELNIVHQDYCGCLFSLAEKKQRLKNKAH